MKRTRWPFNKHPYLKFPYIACSFLHSLPSIHIKTCKNYLDRIQISISTVANSYGHMHKILDDKLGKGVVKRDKNKLIKAYLCEGCKLQLVSYDQKDPYWFAVILQDPTPASQSLLRDMLLTLPHSEIYLSQIEFAWDFYVENEQQAKTLNYEIGHSIVLKHSRINSFAIFKTTYYQGKKGNVRDGSKGLRVYPKIEGGNHFVRVEVQTNRDWIREKLKLDLLNLPIDASCLDFTDCVAFFKGLTVETMEKVVNRIINDMWKNRTPPRSNLARKAREVAERRRIVRRILNHADSAKYEEYDLPPVCKQISNFKKVKKHFGFSNQVSQYFPKISSSA